MQRRWDIDPFDRMAEAPCPQVLTGQFLVSPVGWLPKSDPASALAVSFVSLSDGPDVPGGSAGEGALLFSTN